MRRSPFTTGRGPEARRRPDQLPSNRPLPAIYRQTDAAGTSLPSGELARDTVLAWVEAALLAADEPLTARRLAFAAGLEDGTEARRQVRLLQAIYDQDGTAFQVQELAGGFQLMTRETYHPWLARLRRTGVEAKLTPAMRETLAIVAYRQPIMRADIETVRGVHAGEILRQLMEKGLVRIAGRDSSLGRPVLYGTTKKFLQVFGLNSVKDLPQVEELKPPPKSVETDPP